LKLSVVAAACATLTFAAPAGGSNAAREAPALIAASDATPAAADVTPAPQPSAVAAPESTGPVPTPNPTPAGTARPKEAPRMLFGRRPTPSPSPSPTATPLPTAPPTAAPTPEPTPTVTPTVTPTRRVPTPLPAANGTFEPIAPDQLTIPDSTASHAVRAIIARPIRELAQIGWMTGTWKAHVVQKDGNGKSHERGLGTYVFGTTMKGRYMFGADGKARDYLYLTFDPFVKRWVLVRFEGNPSYGVWVSHAGWSENRIDFVSEFAYANGRPYRRRTTLVHKGARAFGIYDDEELADGTWARDRAVELNKQP